MSGPTATLNLQDLYPSYINHKGVEWDEGAWMDNLRWWTRGGYTDHNFRDTRIGNFHFGGNDVDEPIFDEGMEFGEIDLDVARTRVWTKEIEAANQKWYHCKRRFGRNHITACFEEGELVRREHWRHQLQIRESGCEEQWFRYAKCLGRSRRRPGLCLDVESTFQHCIIAAGNMDLLPDVPQPLKRDRKYSGWFFSDIRQYRLWIKRRDKFLAEHPDWFSEEDVENMTPRQLFNFVQKNQPWVEAGDRKPFTTYQLPIRHREYIPKNDLLPDYR